MQGFARTYGVGAPLHLQLFNKAPGPDDLIHIYEALSREDCEQLSGVVSKAQCWVRVAPKVGQTFDNMEWLEHLSGCSKLWLDLTDHCQVTTQNIERLSKDVKALVLPYRSGAMYATVAYHQLTQLESLTLSGPFKNLDFLKALVHLRELKLFRVKTSDLIAIKDLNSLESLSIEKCRLGSLRGIETGTSLQQLSLFSTRVTESCDLTQCLALERLEMVACQFNNAPELPNRNLKYLRIASVAPAFSLSSVWGIASLQFLAIDTGYLDIKQGFIPLPHASLKQLYLGQLDRRDAIRLSQELGVKIVLEERDMPSVMELDLGR